MANTLPSSVIDLLKRNNAVQASWPELPRMEQMRARTTGEGVQILTCMDPRASPAQFFAANELGVLRNAGGRANMDVVRSAQVFQSLGFGKTLLVVHHEDCGMTHLTEEQIKREGKERAPSAEAAAELDKMTLGTWSADDNERILKEDVRWLRAVPSLAGMQIHGAWLDLKTGRVSHVPV